MTKIFVVGTHGVGKTTLVNEIAKELKKENIPVQVVPELARFIIDTFQFDPIFLSSDVWRDFQTTLLEYYLFSHYFPSHIPVISDRSVFDVLAYIKVGTNIRPTHFSTVNYENFVLLMKKKINECLEKHQSIFYFYLIDNPKLPYQIEVQECLLNIFKKFYIHPVFFRRKNVDEIKEVIKEKIKKEGKNDYGSN